GNICFRVFCRLAVFISVHAENCEVNSVTGPLPIISVTSKFSHVLRRSYNQPDIFIALIDENKKLVPLEQSAYSCLDTLCRVGKPAIDACEYFLLSLYSIHTC